MTRDRFFHPAAAILLLSVAGAPSLPALSAQQLRVEASPSVVIGAEAIDAAGLEVLTNATRLPDGQIVVGNRGSFALHLFDARGRFVRRVAQKGRGPGEVTGLGFVYRCGNALFTQDLLQGGLMQEFSLELTYRRRFRFAVQPYRMSCNERQQFVQMGWEADSDMKDRTFRSLVDWIVAPADSTKGFLLGRFPGAERYANEQQPLGREPRAAIGADRIFLALADSLHILVFDRTGKALPSYRAPWSPVAVTDADWTAERERTIAQFGEQTRAMVEQSFQKLPRPRTLPATRDLLVDPLGLLWVQQFPRGGDTPVTWTVFDTRGSVAARISLPSSLEVLEIGRDYLLGFRHDPRADFPIVQVHRLHR